jgi:hypothetical protein
MFHLAAYTLLFLMVIMAMFQAIQENQKYHAVLNEQDAAIDACAREANVYPESCQMKAVVVTPREEPAPDATSALLPPPVGMKG